MGKLKTAEEARKEIFSKYFEADGYVGTGFAVFRGRMPSLQKEACFNERDCLDVIKTKDDILDEILHDYFEPLTEGMKYRDSAGNVYRSKLEALNSIREGLYNSSKSKRIYSEEASFNG